MQTIFIAMPTSGQVRTETMTCLIDLTLSMHQRGIGFAVKTFQGSDIVMSRNALMSQFFTDQTFSHILLVDSDMSFHPDVIFRLLDFNADFACAAYPQRNLSLERFRSAVEENAKTLPAEQQSTEDLLAACLNYNVQQALDPGVPFDSEFQSGFRTVPGAGTGLMLIQRNVPETMVENGVAPARPRHETLPLYANCKFHDFFSHLTSKDNAIIYGEDQSFCRRWIEGCAGKIWCDETAIVTHHGDFAYRGVFKQTH